MMTTKKRFDGTAVFLQETNHGWIWTFLALYVARCGKFNPAGEAAGGDDFSNAGMKPACAIIARLFNGRGSHQL